MQIVLTGQFDDKIKEIKEIQADLIRRQGIVDTLDAATAIKKDVDDCLAGSREQGQNIIDKANTLLDKAMHKMKEIMDRETDILKQEEKLKNNIEMFEQNKDITSLEFQQTMEDWNEKCRNETQNFTSMVKAKNDEFDRKEKELAHMQDKFTSERFDFAEQQRAFQAKVEAIMKG